MNHPTSQRPRGYALLLGVLVMAVMLTIVLTVTSVLMRQLRSASQLTSAAQALAAADAGVEEALRDEFQQDDLLVGAGAEINLTDDSTYQVTVVDLPGGERQVVSTGRARGATRAIELTY